MKKRILSVALAASLLIPCVATAATVNAAILTDNAEVSATDYGLADNIQDGTILHCFDWKYTDIKAELKNIAEAGFTSIQTSPVQGNNNHGSWYWQYLPRGFYVGTNDNDLGTKQELQDLINEADKYGIKVIVDVVANHLEGSHNNIVDDLKPSQYWHNSGYSSNGDNGTQRIDWKNRWQVTHGDIGMADLATENSYVQQVVGKYVQELKAMGVDGIRWDAAKHIGLPSEGDNFWKEVTKYGLYNYGEILGGPDDRESGNEGLMKEYTTYMSVTDNTYGSHLCGGFRDGTATTTTGIWTEKGISADKLVYWGESHDTFSNKVKDGGWTKYISQNVVDRAYAIAASRNAATSLYFSRPSTTNCDDITVGAKGSTHFTSAEVSEVNKFHNAMIGKADYYAVNDNCSVVTRKDGGAVIVKGSGSGSFSVPNGGGYVKPGKYIDHVSGNEITVTNSTISGDTGSSGIVVIYEDVKPTPKVSVTPGSSTYKTDTYTLTLNVKNAASGQYSIDGGAYQTYTDGQTIPIGAGLAYGTKTTVTVKATNEYGSADEAYTYTKADPNQVQRIYFDNSSYNWSNIYAYVYSGKVSNAKWPGIKMTKDSATGYYVIDVDDSLANGAVIFSDGTNSSSNRYPADMQPGLDLEGTTKLFKAGNQFVDYQPVQPTTATQPTTVKPTTQPTTATQPTSSTQPTTPVENILIGDVNQDGKITISDVSEIQLHIAEMATLTGNNLVAADVNGDGIVDVKDATYIQSYIVNIAISGSKVGTYTGGVQPTTAPTQPTTSTQPTQAQGNVVYYKNTSNFGTPTAYYWSDDDAKMVSWPGKAMTKVSGDVYSIEVPDGTQYIIFSDNGGNKTNDLTIPGFGQIYNNGSWSNYSTDPTTPTPTSPTVSGSTVYFKNTSNFGTPTAYYWSDDDAKMVSWPGKAMTKVSGDVYSIEVPDGTQYIIFSDNGGNKTNDLTIPSFGQIYANGSWSAYNG